MGRSRTSGVRVLTSAVAVLLLAVAVTVAVWAWRDGRASAGPGGAASCASLLDFDGQRYVEVGLVREPLTGRRLGTGAAPGCDDGNGRVPDRRTTVLALQGVDPAGAVSSEGQVWVAGDGALPDGLREAAEPVPCDLAGPARVEGAWQSVDAQASGGDGRLPASYGITLRTTDRTLADGWAAVRLEVRVPRSARRPSEAEVVRMLQEGEPARITLHCEDRRFVADVLAPA